MAITPISLLYCFSLNYRKIDRSLKPFQTIRIHQVNKKNLRQSISSLTCLKANIIIN